MKRKLLNIFHRLQMFFVLRKHSTLLLIYDIDNTIADTWKYLTPGKQTTNKIFRELTVFPSFAEKIGAEYKKNGYKILFFTVRPAGAWFTTISWLRKNGFPVQWSDVLFFANPGQKVDLLSSIAQMNKVIIFVDDMSYNHEHGNVLFFTKEIERIKNLPITYVGADAIIVLQNSTNLKKINGI